jgi:hypothetical protein
VKELAEIVKVVLAKKETANDTDEGKKALNSLIDWALRQKEKEREENSPKAFADMVRELKEILPAPAPPAAPAPQTDMAALLRLAKELQPPPAPNPLELLETAKGLFSPPQDEMANIDRLLSIADKLASLRGGGGGGEARSGWNLGLDYVRELVPLAPYLAGLFNIRAAAPAPGTAPGAAPAPPTHFDPYRQPDLARQHAQTLNGSAAAQAATATPPGPHGPQGSAGVPPANDAAPPDALLATFQMYGGLVVSALNGGVPGFDFADHLVALTGTATHAMVSAHGENALVHAMQQIPEIALFGEARLRQFTKEFIDFEKYLEEADSEEEPEELLAERKRKKHAAVA